MPKKRIIAGLVVRNGIVVQSIGFRRYLPVGRPEIAARFIDSWGIDEIVLVDIDATGEGRTIDPALVERVAEEIRVPLTVGGGIRDTAAMRTLLSSGADKIAVNTAAIGRPDLVGEAAAIFGVQCIIASIDVRRHPDDRLEVFVAGGREATGRDAVAVAAALEAAGAGEVLLNSIDRDGSQRGYDLPLAQAVGSAITVPLICFGGAGHPEHIVDALSCEAVSAAGAANFWHYAEHSVTIAKSFGAQKGIDLRNATAGTYAGYAFNRDGRLARRDDAALEAQIFEYFEEEAI